MTGEVIKYNANRDVEKIVSQSIDRTVKQVKFGMIRLAGEKNKRRVSWETYHKLATLPQNFTGKMEIGELGITVPVSQIVFQEELEETITEVSHFANLPTDEITLDWNLHVISKPRHVLEREGIPYVLATVHYTTSSDGQKLYCIEDLSKIKRAIFMKPQPDGYPHAVCRVVAYGREFDLESGKWL